MKPTDTELTLMKPLWAHAPLSARELHDAAGAALGWSPSSTRKTLDRMVEKGLLTTQSVHGVKTFLPAEQKLETLARMISGFARTVLGSKGPLPAAAFVGSEVIDADEVEELEALLRQYSDKGEEA